MALVPWVIWSETPTFTTDMRNTFVQCSFISYFFDLCSFCYLFQQESICRVAQEQKQRKAWQLQLKLLRYLVANLSFDFFSRATKVSCFSYDLFVGPALLHAIRAAQNYSYCWHNFFACVPYTGTDVQDWRNQGQGWAKWKDGTRNLSWHQKAWLRKKTYYNHYHCSASSHYVRLGLFPWHTVLNQY